MFVVAQLVGALAATGLILVLYPRIAEVAEDGRPPPDEDTGAVEPDVSGYGGRLSTPALAQRPRTAASVSGRSRNHAHLPRCSRSRRPARTRRERWWLTVACDRPTAGRSHAHLARGVATMLTRRRRTGSARAFRTPASSRPPPRRGARRDR